jgi:hypothetical protein
MSPETIQGAFIAPRGLEPCSRAIMAAA